MTERNLKGQFVGGGNGNLLAPILFNARPTGNATQSAPRGGGSNYGGDLRRNIDDECGFPGKGRITLEDYAYLFERLSVAARVVEIAPRETWKVSPSVYEDEDSGIVTEFEQALSDLGKQLRGESWYESGGDEQGNPVWQMLQLVDELSGVGQFGVLLLGLAGDEDLSEPSSGINPDGTRSEGAANELRYLRAYDQTKVQIDQYERDKSNPRYGKPTMYTIQVAGYDSEGINPGSLPDVGTIKVHWSRVIHVADLFHQSTSSDVFAIPRMRPVYNELLSCRKIAGASGEFYWNHGSRDLIIESHPQLGGRVRFPANMKSEVENFQTGLQRSLRLAGASAKTLSPAVSDPTPHLMIQVKLICVKIGCPERIFWGSERGELSSSQDERGWADRIMGRQNGYVTPRIIVPFIDRCIQLGILPEPEQYYVAWPNLRDLSPQERAVVVGQRMEAMAKYVGGNVSPLMAPIDFLTRELDYSQEEATQILKTAQEEPEVPDEEPEEQPTTEQEETDVDEDVPNTTE